MSKTYTVQAPDGKTITLEGPDGASPADVIAQAQRLYQPETVKAEASTAQSESNITQSPLYQSTIGANPSDLLERMKGLGRSVGRPVMGALQYIQYLAGQKVSPTPLSLEPSSDPNQHIGEMIGHAALTAAPSIATSGAAIPIQAAVGALVGGSEGGVPGAVVGGLLPSAVSGAGEVASKLAERVNIARIFNKVAGVPAGRKGAEVSMSTGLAKTNPGNAPIRMLEDEGAGPLSKLKAAAFARPTPELQVRVYGELQGAGNELRSHLAQSKTTIDLAGILPDDVAKMRSALVATGVPKQNVDAILLASKFNVTPAQAHELRSAIGERINWNPTVVSDGNDALKDAWSEIGDRIKSAVPDIEPYNKRWQEGYLYARALQQRLNDIARGGAIPPSLAESTAVKAAKALAVGGTATEAINLLWKSHQSHP